MITSTPTASIDTEAISHAVETLRARRRIPGLSIAIADSHGLIHASGHGSADLATGRPATPATSYLWFSLTKIAVATATLRLADQGRLDLQAPVSAYVSDPAGPGRTTTARVGQLLDHTAGYRNPLPLRWVRPAHRPARPPDEFLRMLLDRHGAPRHEIGGPARYSNLGYLVLGAVIAAATGESFEEHLRREILEPVGMRHTGFTHQRDGLAATGYVRAPRLATPVLKALLPPATVGTRTGANVALQPFYVEGASFGGLVGDVTDVSRLVTLHLADGSIDGRQILKPATARQMRQVTTAGKPFDLAQGWFCHPDHRSVAHPYVEHLGAGAGFWNAMRLYPNDGIGIVVLSNTTAAFDHHSLLEAVRSAAIDTA